MSSFDELPTSDLDDVFSLSLQQLGWHLHIIWSISILELLCNWKLGNLPLDFFLHIEGTPMITIGDILIHDDVQATILWLLDHVGSPASLMHHSRHSHSHQSQSSLGSCTGTHIDIPTPINIQPLISSSVTSISLVNNRSSTVSPTHQPLITPVSPLHPIPEDTQAPAPVEVAVSPHWSTRFPNVDLSLPYWSNSPRLTVLHGTNGLPLQTSVPLASMMSPSAPTGHNASTQMVHPSTSQTLPMQPNFGSPTPTGWDQYKGSNHTFFHPIPSCQHILQSCAQNSNLNMHNIGAHWMHFILDLHKIYPIVDPITHSIPPWCAYCPDHDVELLHFPAAVPNAYIDQDLFITSFNCPWDSKNQADFLKHFPPLPLKATIRDLLPFYNKLVPHCQGYYIFVPPLSMLRSGIIMGTWFDNLSDGIKSKCLHHFSTLLLTALCQKNVGLLGHPSLDFLVTGTDDGYFALYQLAQLGGHLILNPYPVVLQEPIQDTDMDLASYLANWIQYLMTQALSGYFLSDWYFVIKFVTGLHSSLWLCLGADLECHIDHPCYDNHPLPFDFTPAHLWICLQQHAQFLGLHNQILTAPREVQWNLNVHQLLNHSSNDNTTSDSDLLITALTTGSPTCFFCHETSHMAPACPLLLCTKSDPFAQCLIVRLLQDHQSSSTPQLNTSTTCSTSNHSACIHAILVDTDIISDQDDAPLMDNPEELLDSLLSDPKPPRNVASSVEQDFHFAH